VFWDTGLYVDVDTGILMQRISTAGADLNARSVRAVLITVLRTG
jgi:hypothetical protein